MIMLSHRYKYGNHKGRVYCRPMCISVYHNMQCTVEWPVHYKINTTRLTNK